MATSSSVRPATSAYSFSTPASVSPGSIRNSSARSAQSASVILVKSPIADGPSRMKSTQFRSTDVTCLIRPPRHNALAVVRCPTCSSVRSRVVKRRKYRCLASASSRSARSPVAAGATVVDSWGDVVSLMVFSEFREWCSAGFPRSSTTLGAQEVRS
ncbi:hypothetical protein SAURM35S_07366 [Streptomyces aurantiogriseus]